MRIASLLPAATEIVWALGAGDDLVGISHECDFPPEVTTLPRLTRTRLHAPPDPSSAATSAEIGTSPSLSSPTAGARACHSISICPPTRT